MSSIIFLINCDECEKHFENLITLVGEEDNEPDRVLCLDCYRQAYNIYPEELDRCDDCGDEFGTRCDLEKVIIKNTLYCNFCAPRCEDCGDELTEEDKNRGRLDDNCFYCSVCVANYEHNCDFCDDLWYSIADGVEFGEYECLCPTCIKEFKRDHFECDGCDQACPIGDKVINYTEKSYCAACFCEAVYDNETIELEAPVCECGKKCSLVPRSHIEICPDIDGFFKDYCGLCIFKTNLNLRDIVCNGSRVPFLMSLKIGSVPTAMINRFLGGTLETQMLSDHILNFQDLVPGSLRPFFAVVGLKSIEILYDTPLQIQVLYIERKRETIRQIHKDFGAKKKPVPMKAITETERLFFNTRLEFLSS